MVRRRGVWVPINSGSSVAAGASIYLNLLGAASSVVELMGGHTIFRMIGELKYRTEVVGTYQQFSAGIMVLNEEVGTTTDMSLSGEAHDQMWSLNTRTSGMFSEAAAGDFDSIEEVRFIDVRAQRKLPANSELRFVIGNGAGQTIFFNIGLRIYLKLP